MNKIKEALFLSFIFIIFLNCSKQKENPNKYSEANFVKVETDITNKSVLLLTDLGLFYNPEDNKYYETCKEHKVLKIIDYGYLTYTFENKRYLKAMIKVSCPNIGWIEENKTKTIIGNEKELNKNLNKWILFSKFKESNLGTFSLGYGIVTITEDGNIKLQVRNGEDENIIEENFNSFFQIDEDTWELSNSNSRIRYKSKDFISFEIIYDKNNRFGALKNKKYRLRS